MQLIKPNTKIDFMGRRRLFALISVCAVVASILLVIYPGPKYGIDFTGGTQIQLAFSDGTDIADIRSALTTSGHGNADVVAFGDRPNEYLITVQQLAVEEDEEDRERAERQELEENARERISKAFSEEVMIQDSLKISPSGDRLWVRFSDSVDVERLEKVIQDSGLRVIEHQEDEVPSSTDDDDFQVCTAPVCRVLPLSEYKYEAHLIGVAGMVLDGLRENLGDDRVSDPLRTIYVGPKVGNQLKMAGIKSLLYAIGFIMLYIAVRFDLRFAPGAVVALLHDVAITLGIFVIIRHEVSLPIIAALLTIVGYSLNDTIVVFDRIRENFQKLRERELSLVVNQSINETLSRTLLTSITTLLTVGSIFVFGGGLIKDFALALIIGVLVGTYSSIFVASPVVVFLDQRFFHKQASG